MRVAGAVTPAAGSAADGEGRCGANTAPAPAYPPASFTDAARQSNGQNRDRCWRTVFTRAPVLPAATTSPPALPLQKALDIAAAELAKRDQFGLAGFGGAVPPLLPESHGGHVATQ